jgi:Flp pilus assembly pilin Flp
MPGLKLKFMRKNFKLIKNQNGQALAEYSWIVVLIAVFVLVMLTFTGKSVENKYIEINSSVTNAMQ